MVKNSYIINFNLLIELVKILYSNTKSLEKLLQNMILTLKSLKFIK